MPWLIFANRNIGIGRLQSGGSVTSHRPRERHTGRTLCHDKSQWFQFAEDRPRSATEPTQQLTRLAGICLTLDGCLHKLRHHRPCTNVQGWNLRNTHRTINIIVVPHLFLLQKNSEIYWRPYLQIDFVGFSFDYIHMTSFFMFSALKVVLQRWYMHNEYFNFVVQMIHMNFKKPLAIEYLVDR